MASTDSTSTMETTNEIGSEARASASSAMGSNVARTEGLCDHDERIADEFDEGATASEPLNGARRTTSVNSLVESAGARQEVGEDGEPDASSDEGSSAVSARRCALLRCTPQGRARCRSVGARVFPRAMLSAHTDATHQRHSLGQARCARRLRYCLHGECRYNPGGDPAQQSLGDGPIPAITLATPRPITLAAPTAITSAPPGSLAHP
jgi:hypothetical protein